MKKVMGYFGYVLLLTLLTTSVMYAQTPVKNQDRNAPQKNLSARSLMASYNPRTISWWNSGNGFICKYTIDNISYLTRSDKEGNYIETLKQKVWNESSALWLDFHQSQYKLLRVISYWEVSDVGKKGYYLEMRDSKNQISSVWADESRKFSMIPVNKPKQ